MKDFARIAVAAAVVATACAAPASAQSQVRDLSQSGAWAARMLASDQGAPMCAMSSVTQQVGFHLKYFRGAQNMVVHIFREGWQMRQGAQVAMALDIDRDARWNASVTSIGDGVEFTIGQQELPRFERALRSGQVMTIRLGQDNKAVPMQVALNGADAVAGAFIGCMRAINGQGAAPGAGAEAPQRPGPRQQPVQSAPPASRPGFQPRDLDA